MSTNRRCEVCRKALKRGSEKSLCPAHEAALTDLVNKPVAGTPAAPNAPEMIIDIIDEAPEFLFEEEEDEDPAAPPPVDQSPRVVSGSMRLHEDDEDEDLDEDEADEDEADEVSPAELAEAIAELAPTAEAPTAEPATKAKDPVRMSRMTAAHAKSPVRAVKLLARAEKILNRMPAEFWATVPGVQGAMSVLNNARETLAKRSKSPTRRVNVGTRIVLLAKFAEAYGLPGVLTVTAVNASAVTATAESGVVVLLRSNQFTVSA